MTPPWGDLELYTRAASTLGHRGTQRDTEDIPSHHTALFCLSELYVNPSVPAISFNHKIRNGKNEREIREAGLFPPRS